jgi:hypothetical protein
MEHDQDEEVEETEEVNDQSETAPVTETKTEEVAPPVEDLPEEKPFDGEAKLYLGGSVAVNVSFADSSLPRWLSYIVADDLFWFLRTSTTAEGEAEGGIVAEKEPAQEEGTEDNSSKRKPQPQTPFEPNFRFVLELESESPTTYAAKLPSVPAAPVEATATKPNEEEEQEEAQPEVAKPVAITPTLEEEKGDSEELTIDAMTLAAIFSPDIFSYLLERKEASLSGLESWLQFTVGEDNDLGQALVNNLLRAAETLKSRKLEAHEAAAQKHQKEAPSGDEPEGAAAPKVPFVPPRVALDFCWIFEKLSQDAKRFSTMCLRTLRSLLSAGYVPQKPPTPSILRNSAAVQAYALLLVGMPRSVATKWIGKLSEEPDEKPELSPLSYFCGQILLDLRTRNARRTNGKASKSDAAAVHRKILSAWKPQFDGIIATPFESRPYCPETLELRDSDLILLLLALSPQEIGGASFQDFFQLRNRAVQPLTSGTNTLLMDSLHLMNSRAALAFIASADSGMCRSKGSVDMLSWARSHGRLFPDDFVKPFSQRYFSSILSQNEVVAALKTEKPTLLESMEKCQETLNSFEESVRSGKAEVHDLEAMVSAGFGEVVLTPYVLWLAIEASHATLVEELFIHQRITQVTPQSRTAKPITAIEHALRSRNVAMSSLLVHLGADLSVTWDGGKLNGMIFIEDFWKVSGVDVEGNATDAFGSAERKNHQEQNAVAEDLLLLWKTREHERGTDPSKLYGLRVSAPPL